MDARLRNRRHRSHTDERLAALVRMGDVGAFEELYDRHHAALLAFCRHMVGNREDGEDALQQTFLRAHRALAAGPTPDAVRPWLYAIARNRCLTLLGARKPPAVPAEDVEVAFDGLAEDVRRRADLRELVADLARLPEDQRGALVLHELGDLAHAEIATVIGCPPDKVKALVFQARTSLIAERDARATPCEEIRGQLEIARAGALRRGPLRRHLRQCEPCDTYRRAVARQRTGIALILPVAPTAGLKAAILGGAATSASGAAVTVSAAGGAAAAGGAVAGTAASIGGGTAVAAKAIAAKVAVAAVVAGGATGGAVAVDGPAEPRPVRAASPAVETRSPVRDVRSARSAERTSSPASRRRRARPAVPRLVRRASVVQRRAPLRPRRLVRRAARVVAGGDPSAVRRVRRRLSRARRNPQRIVTSRRIRRRRAQPPTETVAPPPAAETEETAPAPRPRVRPRRRPSPPPEPEPEPALVPATEPAPEPTAEPAPEPTPEPAPEPEPTATPGG